MPFKMKRPVIKGSKQHKTSIAKSIVAQTRTQADPSLVEAGKILGESIVPHEIDYSLRGLSSLDYGGDDDNDNDDDKRDRMPTEKIPRKKAKKLKVKRGKGPDLKKRKIPKKKKKSSVSIDLDYYKKSAKIQKDKKTTTSSNSNKKTTKKTTKKNKPKVSAWLSKLFKSKNA